MKMNKISREKKVATLSIVFNMTTNCLLNAGIKRTNLSIRNKRNVRKTDTPVPELLSILLPLKVLISS